MLIGLKNAIILEVIISPADWRNLVGMSKISVSSNWSLLSLWVLNKGYL